MTRLCLSIGKASYVIKEPGKEREETWLMRYGRYRIDIILAIALITVPILIGGQVIYRQISIVRPLVDELRAFQEWVPPWWRKTQLISNNISPFNCGQFTICLPFCN